MGQWYKIPKDSPTGKRLQVVSDRREDFRKAWLEYREKYGPVGAAFRVEHICDVLAFTFENEPDETIWHQLKGGDFKGCYKPIQGTAAYKDWQKLRKLRVKHIELDHAMGATGDWSDVGINWGKDEYFFVHYRFRHVDYLLGEECVPITDAEYRMMTGDKDSWYD